MTCVRPNPFRSPFDRLRACPVLDTEANGSGHDSMLDSERRNSPTRTLDVFVAAHCAASATARCIAADVARAAPDLTVRVVDVDAEFACVPPAVVAVPTYVVDGRLIHLGNPSPAWRSDLLSRWEKGAAHGS